MVFSPFQGMLFAVSAQICPVFSNQAGVYVQVNALQSVKPVETRVKPQVNGLDKVSSPPEPYGSKLEAAAALPTLGRGGGRSGGLPLAHRNGWRYSCAAQQ